MNRRQNLVCYDGSYGCIWMRVGSKGRRKLFSFFRVEECTASFLSYFYYSHNDVICAIKLNINCLMLSPGLCSELRPLFQENPLYRKTCGHRRRLWTQWSAWFPIVPTWLVGSPLVRTFSELPNSISSPLLHHSSPPTILGNRCGWGEPQSTWCFRFSKFMVRGL